MNKMAIASLIATTLSSAAFAGTPAVWISGSGSGIYRAAFDPATGKLGKPELAAACKSGSWLAFHPSKPILYASYAEGDRSGVASFAIAESGTLEKRDVLFLAAGAPAHIAVNPQATLLALSHYSGGASALAALAPDGTIKKPDFVFNHTLEKPGPTDRQTAAHPHFASFTPDGSRVHHTDLGADAIWTFDVSANPLTQTLLHKSAVPAGYGPRHLSFHPSRKFAYASEELGSRISAFSYDEASATFKPLQHLVSTGGEKVDPANNTSHILVHPSGRFVYVGNRGHDSIGAFAIDQKSGRLAFIETEHARGHWPRNFVIDPTGRWLLAAGQDSNTIGTMEIDQSTGALAFVRYSVVNVPNPVCVLFR